MMSNENNIPFVLKAFAYVKPKRMMDIGPGFGKYGLLFREHYLGLQVDESVDIPVDDIVIDASEITEYFLKRPALKALYDNVYEKDFRTLSFKDYDLVTMIDVVEHYPKEETMNWLMLQEVPFLISTPKETVMYQRHLYGDPHHHESQWTEQDFQQFGNSRKFKIKDFSSPHSFIYLIEPK